MNIIPAKECASCKALVTPEKKYCPRCLSSVFLPTKATLIETDRPRYI